MTISLQTHSKTTSKLKFGDKKFALSTLGARPLTQLNNPYFNANLIKGPEFKPFNKRIILIKNKLYYFIR
jgi:hypothetical protein